MEEIVQKKPYFIYILRCEDQSLYTGITTDPYRRFQEHQSNHKGAKYTRVHRPVKIESLWQTQTKVLAAKLEYQIKQLKKTDKERLISDNPLTELLGNKLDVTAYTKVEIKKVTSDLK